MKIKVLQGVNLLNPITTIIAELDGKPDITLIDEIKETHEIFMYDYRVEGNKVAVVSKLPHFWKIAFASLNELATGHKDRKEIREYLFGILIRLQAGSMSGIPTIHAAQKAGVELTQMMIEEGIADNIGWNRTYALGVGKEMEYFKQASTSRDSKDAKSLQKDKYNTNKLVSRLCLPIAKWAIVDDEEHLEALFKDFPKPFVLKPVGLTQGAGVVTKIETVEQALSAYKKAHAAIHNKPRSKWQTKIMIQQQVEGDDYRLLVVDGKLEIATWRIPAYVTGDGKSTIEELVTEANKDPRRNLNDPTHILKPIVIDGMMHDYLEDQGKSLAYIPTENERVYVRKIASMSRGGMTEDVTDKVHPQIKYLVESLASTAKAFVMGVDVMCKDISKPLTIENGSFIEMNTMPEAFLNAFPTVGKQYPEIGEIILKGLMKDKPRTQRIVVIGGTIEDALKKTSEPDKRVGLHSDGSIYISGELMNSGLTPWSAIEGLKLNATLDTVVLHYPNTDEVKDMGLGFDEIDNVILMGTPEYEQKLNELKEQGYIKNITKIN